MMVSDVIQETRKKYRICSAGQSGGRLVVYFNPSEEDGSKFKRNQPRVFHVPLIPVSCN